MTKIIIYFHNSLGHTGILITFLLFYDATESTITAQVTRSTELFSPFVVNQGSLIH